METNGIYTLVLATGESETLSLSDILARSPRTLLYFYPRDNTPGCTLEGQEFTALASEFKKLNIQIIGISRDSAQKHGQFMNSCGIRLPLIADTDGSLHDHYAVIGTKKMYGRETKGVIRSTFLVDRSGTTLREWRDVRANGHAKTILETLSSLS